MSQIPIDSSGLDTTLATELVNASGDELVELTLKDVAHALDVPQSGGVKRKAREIEEEEPAGAGAGPAEGAAEGPAGAGAGPGAGDGDGDGAGPSAAPAPEATGESAPKKVKTEETLTQQAIQEMVTRLDGMAGGVARTVDAAAAKVIGVVPDALSAVISGSAVSVAINNPTIFGQIVQMVSNGVSAVVGAGATAVWDDYASAVETAARALGGVFSSVSNVSTSPWFVFTSALLVMRYRASSQGKTVTELMKEDARRLKSASDAVAGAVGAGAGAATSAIRTAVEAQAAEFTKAYSQEARAKTARRLSDIGRQVKPPKGEGATSMSRATWATGAPAAQSGPEGGIALVPSQAPRDVRTALATLASAIPPPPAERAAAEALASLGSATDVTMSSGEGAQPMDEDKPPKGGRRHRRTKRKTYRKKKAPKKTRGRRDFIY
jgi:hypothetical protein